MRTYKILPDFQSFYAFTLPMKDVLLSLGKKVPPQKLMHFYRYNLLLGEKWQALNASFVPVEGITKSSAIPDITAWVSGTLALSDKAIKSLNGIESFGELLPVDTSNGRYWILNCTNVIHADESKSSNLVEAGQVLDVQSLAFKDEHVERVGLFKTEFDGFRNLYCSEQVKLSIENAGLTGLIFSEELEGGF